MTDFEERVPATFQLRLDTSENSEAKGTTVQVGAGEPFKMECTVIGDHHENPDLHWNKDGSAINNIDSLTIVDSPPGSLSKSIEFTKFNAATHGGVYECGVKRKDEKYHIRKMRIEERQSNTEIAVGFKSCPRENQGTCLNGGVCMQHEASGSISCLCVNQRKGQRCEYAQPTQDSSKIVPAGYQAGMATMGIIVVALVTLLAIGIFIVFRQKRQIKKIAGGVKSRFSHDSLCADVEMRLLNAEREQTDGGSLQPTFLAVQTADQVQFCWNCGYSQSFIDGSYQKRPSGVQIARLPGSTRGSPSGSMHRTPSFRGPGNKDIVETGHGALANGAIQGLIRVASLPTTPSAMGPFFEDFDRHCPDCLAQLRAHYYPDSPDMYDKPAFDGLPNGSHQADHHAQRKEVKKHTVAFQTQSQNPTVRPTALEFKARSRLPGVSEERLEAPRDNRKAVSSPSTPKSMRKMALPIDQNHHQHVTNTSTDIDDETLPSNGHSLA